MTWKKFRELITIHFDIEELRTLCFDLDIDFDNLRGEGKEAKVRELVAMVRRTNRISDCVILLSELRPHVSWSHPTSKPMDLIFSKDFYTENSIVIGFIAVIFLFLLFLFVRDFFGIFQVAASHDSYQQASQDDEDYREPSEVFTPIVTMNPNTLSKLEEELNTRESGLQRKCIKSELWIPLNAPSTQDESCLGIGDWGIIAQEKGLIISNDGSSHELRQGIYTPIIEPSIISFKLQLNNLSTPFENNISNIAFGIIPADPLDLTMDGQLIYQKESPEDDYPIFLKHQERGDYDQYVVINDQYVRYSEGTPQQLRFVIHDGYLSTFVDEIQIQQVFLPYAEKAFWIGYRLSAYGEVQAYISDFQIMGE